MVENVFRVGDLKYSYVYRLSVVTTQPPFKISRTYFSSRFKILLIFITKYIGNLAIYYILQIAVVVTWCWYSIMLVHFLFFVRINDKNKTSWGTFIFFSLN